MQTVPANCFLLTQEVLSATTFSCLPSDSLCFETRPSVTLLIPRSNLSAIKYSIYREWRMGHPHLPFSPFVNISASPCRRLQFHRRGPWNLLASTRWPESASARAPFGAGVGSNMLPWRVTDQGGEPGLRLLPDGHAQRGLSLVSEFLVQCALLSVVLANLFSPIFSSSYSFLSSHSLSTSPSTLPLRPHFPGAPFPS